jgi:hypothetical protein
VVTLVILIALAPMVSADHVPGEIVFQVAPEALPLTRAGGVLGSADPELSAVLSGLPLRGLERVFQARTPLAQEMGLDRWFILRTDEDLDVPAWCAELRRCAAVLDAHPNYLVYAEELPNDPRVDDQWAIRVCEVEQAWDVTHGDASVAVAVIDGGYTFDHEDLVDTWWVNEDDPVNGADDDGNGYVDDYRGWNFAYGNNDPTDDDNENFGHGTHVGGIVGAATNNGLGVAGMSWGAKVMVLKIMNAGGVGDVGKSAQAIEYAADNGARVSNHSYGRRGQPAGVETAAVEYAYQKNLVMIAACGNDNLNASHWPSSYEEMLSVAAITDKGWKAGFSNYGPDIDVMAPGQKIWSTVMSGGYDKAMGTSMASPEAAALAALIVSAEPGLSNQEVLERIMLTADDVYDDNPCYVGLLGTGRINYFNALTPDSRVWLDEVMFDDNAGGDGDYSPDSGETVELLVYVKNRSAHTANNVTVTVSSTHPAVEFTTDTVVIPQIDGGSVGVSATPIVFTVGSAGLGETATFGIDIQAADSSYTTTVETTINNPHPYYPGWPRRLCANGFNSSPIPADVDGEGNLEIVVGTGDGLLLCFRPDGAVPFGFPAKPYPEADDEHAPYIIASPSIADIDADGDMEIAIGLTIRTTTGEVGRVAVMGPNGAFEPGWPVDLPAAVKSSVTLADLDGDGDMELIHGSYDNKLYVWTHDGLPFPGSWPVDMGTDVFATAAVGDVDNDGQLEIVVAAKDDQDPSTYGRLSVLRTDGTPLPGWPRDYPDQIYPSPALVDFDQDGDLEIVFGCGDFYNEHADANFLYAIHHDGTPLSGFPVQLPDTMYSSPAIGDITGDGVPDIAFGTKRSAENGGGEVYAYQYDGSLVPGFPYVTGDEVSCSPTIADIDGDNMGEIIIGGDDGFVHAVDGDGGAVPGWPAPVTEGKTVFPAPLVQDLDGDGDLEIAVPDSGARFHIWDLDRVVDEYAIFWPMFHANPQMTGLYAGPSGAPPTPVPSPSPTPVPSPTPSCGAFGVSLEIPTTYVSPGDTFYCRADVCNPGDPLGDQPFVALLDIGIGIYWFYPSWSKYPPDFDYQYLSLAQGITEVDVLAPFTWPDTGTSTYSGINIISAMLTPDFTAINGEFDQVTFAYGP